MPADPNGLGSSNETLEELQSFVEEQENQTKKSEFGTKIHEVVERMGLPKPFAIPNYPLLVPEIPEQFEPKFFRMKPYEEDLLSHGRKLKDGMIVLIEDSMIRVDLEEAFEKNQLGEWKGTYIRERAEQNNRWCRISDVRQTPFGKFAHDVTTSFVAEYADGTKVKRSYNGDYAWYYKLDSNPIADA